MHYNSFVQGPLVVAVKVASDQDPGDPSKYWPPSEPDREHYAVVSV